MIYYKVNKKGFDKRCHFNRDDWGLIPNELYTAKELERFTGINKEWFDEVEIKKTEIHYVFGSRFTRGENHTTNNPDYHLQLINGEWKEI